MNLPPNWGWFLGKPYAPCNIIIISVIIVTIIIMIIVITMFIIVVKPGKIIKKHFWWVVSTPLKNISQLGWLFPIYGKIKLMFQTTNQISVSHRTTLSSELHRVSSASLGELYLDRRIPRIGPRSWLVGGPGPPLWKIWKSIGMIIPNIWENKKCSKPPTRWLSSW